MRSKLDRLADAHGIGLTRPDPENAEVAITEATKRKILAALGVDIDRGGCEAASNTAPVQSMAKPTPKSFLPACLRRNRLWGISLQLYELRSARNWGIGDFEDLVQMITLAGSLGADFVGLNPLHAPFLADPNRCSPYEPSNRQMLNPLYIAVDKVPGFESDPELDARLGELRRTDLVDYVGVTETKITALLDLWKKFRALRGKLTSEWKKFNAFVEDGGEVLRRHALFETLSSHMGTLGRGTGWQSWPLEYQRADCPEIVVFAKEHAETIDFHMWLQWLSHQQLTSAADAARKHGLRIGLYLDLAVGEAVDGSATWSEREAYIADATIGSPPDPFATKGQDWRLAALHPAAIAAGERAPFRRMLCTAMRYAGAIRIDHAAALRRLFLVPVECTPDQGAYVDYPQNELLQILSETSKKFRCLVIGEDLGILPDGLQENLAAAQVLSYRILSYERDEHGFKPADTYPRLSIACISTHDHQTLAGWWRGADIKARLQHGIVPPDLTKTHLEERRHEREDLWNALDDAGTHPSAEPPPPTASDSKLDDLVVRAHKFIAKTSSSLVSVRLADMTAERRPTNIPGTSNSYPNWKPKLSLDLDHLTGQPLLLRICDAMREERSTS
ncbi:4-alpha-glucanotransferase [Rhizobium sp. 2MFCol3.1]|uniref:4-alpha-glucanotransferase n=1 Tax=Rhizobium sp. 2MFCol3.1 TaxID=1246459 RepID=UPI00035C4768|nr:4-alpha-glucanotransferase [Rhizobium sp. 2MFCol3.1]